MLNTDPAIEDRRFVWIEGEAPAATTFNNHPQWYQTTGLDRSLLSPGKPDGTIGGWLVHFATDTTGTGAPVTSNVTATYNFSIDRPGSYYFWMRLNVFSTQFSYSLDGAPEQAIDMSDVASRRTLLANGSLDIRFIGWKHMGLTNLSAGNHTLMMRLSGTNVASVHGGIDAISFTNWNWGPSGTQMPDPLPQPEAAPGDWFTFAPGVDPLDGNSVIDRSSLIEAPAGNRGRVQRNGSDLRFADGTPTKFMGINATPETTPEAMDRQAKLYRKYGINLVRAHPMDTLLGELQGPPENRSLDPVALDRFDRWFSAMKQQGIYVSISIFYYFILKPDTPGIDPALYNELVNRGSAKTTYGMQTFIREYQDAQWVYAQLLLNHVNPYTGLAYKDDPALMSIETRNEDSVFWNYPLNDLWANSNGRWTNHRQRLRTQFGAWVKNKYASEAALTAAWGTARQPADNWAAGVYEMMPAFMLSAGGASNIYTGQNRRAGDFTQFLAEMQRADYELFRSRARGLGYDGLIYTTGWMVGGPSTNAANLWTDDVGDAIDRHEYLGGIPSSTTGRITIGGVRNDSMLGAPGSGLLKAGLQQIDNKPMVMTEFATMAPSWYRAEVLPLTTFYGMGLQGWDATYLFTGRSADQPSAWADLSVFSAEGPLFMNQMPALTTSLMRGDVQQGAAAAIRRKNTSEIFNGFDALTRDYAGGGWSYQGPTVTGNTTIPNEVLALGRVSNEIGTGLPQSQNAGWNVGWNPTARTITSNTNQLYWDYANRFVTVNTPRTQSVVGFAQGRTHTLAGADVQINTNYASLIMTSLDGLPIDDSNRVLVTAVARDRQAGSRFNADGTVLEALGADSLELEPVQADITMKGRPVADVVALDVYGNETTNSVDRLRNSFTIDGRYRTVYYLIKREPVPAPSQMSFVNGTQQSLQITFSKDVSRSISAIDLRLTNTTSGQSIPTSAYTMTYDRDTDRATFVFNTVLPDGVYSAYIPAWSVQDPLQQTLAANVNFQFKVLSGDADGDGAVSFADVLILARNYNTAGRDYTQGDFNRDGKVDFADLLIVANNYGTRL
jgi:hypothetical protein